MEKRLIFYIVIILSLTYNVYGSFSYADDFDANEGGTEDGFAWKDELLSYQMVSTTEDDIIVWDFGFGDDIVVFIKTGECQACRSNWSWLDDYCDSSCGSDEETCVITADPTGTLGYIDTSVIGAVSMRVDTYACDGSDDETWHGTVRYNIVDKQQYDCNNCDWKTESCLEFDYEGDNGIFRDIVEDVSCPVNTECDDLIDENISTIFNEEINSVCRLHNSQACSDVSECLTDICNGGLCGLDDGESTCNDIYDCRDNNCITGTCRNCTSDTDCSGSNPYCDTDGSAPNPEEYMCSCWNRNSPDSCDECLEEIIDALCDCNDECDSGRCEGPGNICLATLSNGNVCDEDSDCNSGICNEDNECGDCYDSGDCSEPTPYCDTDGSYSPNYECGCWDTVFCNQCLDYADGFLCDCDSECDTGLICHTGYDPAALCKPTTSGGFACTRDIECNTGSCSGGFCTYEEIILDYSIIPTNNISNCSNEFYVDVKGSTTDENAEIIYSCYSYTGGLYYNTCLSETESDCTINCPFSNWNDEMWNNTFNFTSITGGDITLIIKLGDDESDTEIDSTSSLCFYCFPYFCGETCSDGIENQDETGIDCGGICGYCDNGILDYWETEIDYGGTCGTCQDSIRNAWCDSYLEDSIDYGGRCGSCDDGLQSLRIGETIIDYGGVCGNCYNNEQDSLINETEIDYGGLFCGYCDLELTKETDELWMIAREIDNSIPFPSHWCEEGQAALIVVNVLIIILIGIGAIGGLAIIGIVIFYIGSNVVTIVTLIASVKRIYDGLISAERVIKGNYTKKELLKEAWNIYRTEKFK